MKLWKIAATVAIGMYASGSGVMQVQAAVFAYQVDFIDKEVANFDDFKQSFSANTYDLNAKLEWTWNGTYYFDSCPTTFTADVQYRIRYNFGSGPLITLGTLGLPDFFCNTSPTQYTAFFSISLPVGFVQNLIDDDANFINFNSTLLILKNNFLGNTLYLDTYREYFNIFYEFDTTYLFNYFLSDQQYVSTTRSTPADWTINSTRISYLEYVYTTAGNDTFLIENSLQVDIGTVRKKYAINVNDVYFRGQSVGAQFETEFVLGIDRLTPVGTGFEQIQNNYRYYYLNTSNYQQPLANVPQFNFTTQDCGSFLALNVGCFINNGLAYITNDAPIISDIFTLLNVGMQLGGQAFNTLGNFTDNNLIGVLVLGGAGLTAVRWFLKQDQ